MNKKKVVIPEHIDESGMKILRDCPFIETVYFDGAASDDELREALKDAHAVMVRSAGISGETLRNSPNLELIAKHGVGYEKVDVAAASKRKIPVTITPGANSDAVAELTVGFILALSRKLVIADQDLKTGRFEKREVYTAFELGGKTVGIIGLGRIGTRVARRVAIGFGMTVIAYDPFISMDYMKSLNVEPVDAIDDLLHTSDYVTIHAPLTPLTQNMIDERELQLMKREAFIINTARSDIINEKALFKALSEGWINGAALDVFEFEPPSPDNTPLLSLDNVIAAPHLGSGSREATRNMAVGAAEEIVRVLGGKRPTYPVNPEIYND